VCQTTVEQLTSGSEVVSVVRPTRKGPGRFGPGIVEVARWPLRRVDHLAAGASRALPDRLPRRPRRAQALFTYARQCSEHMKPSPSLREGPRDPRFVSTPRWMPAYSATASGVMTYVESPTFTQAVPFGATSRSQASCPER